MGHEAFPARWLSVWPAPKSNTIPTSCSSLGPSPGPGVVGTGVDNENKVMPVLPVLIDDLNLYSTTTSGSGSSSSSSGGGSGTGLMKSACGIPRSSFLRAGLCVVVLVTHVGLTAILRIFISYKTNIHSLFPSLRCLSVYRF